MKKHPQTYQLNKDSNADHDWKKRDRVRMASLKGWCWSKAWGGEELALTISVLKWEEYEWRAWGGNQTVSSEKAETEPKYLKFGPQVWEKVQAQSSLLRRQETTLNNTLNSTY